MFSQLPFIKLNMKQTKSFSMLLSSFSAFSYILDFKKISLHTLFLHLYPPPCSGPSLYYWIKTDFAESLVILRFPDVVISTHFSSSLDQSTSLDMLFSEWWQRFKVMSRNMWGLLRQAWNWHTAAFIHMPLVKTNPVVKIKVQEVKGTPFLRLWQGCQCKEEWKLGSIIQSSTPSKEQRWQMGRSSSPL